MAKVAKAVVVLPSYFTDDTSLSSQPQYFLSIARRAIEETIVVELVHKSSSFVNTNMGDSGDKKPEGLKIALDKGLDEVYQDTKPTSKLDLLSEKSSFEESEESKGRVGLKCLFSSNLTLRRHQDVNSSKHAAVANAKDTISDLCGSSDKYIQDRFLRDHSAALLFGFDKSELFGFDKFSEQASVDVDKAFKGLAAPETSGSATPPSSAGKPVDAKSTSLRGFCREIYTPSKEVPLDFTLKTSICIVSSSSVDRLHRLLKCGTYSGMASFSFQSGCFEDPSNSLVPADPCSLNSWIYPQSSLPASVVSVLSSSTDGVEKDFLDKRHLDWEDSFRDLYYKLRKSGCNIFYVCTSQFVVMFTAVDGMGKGKRICNAYISQSTRGMRSLLKEHDISYYMPFNSSELALTSREELVELSEIEEPNLRQYKLMTFIPDMDTTSKSLLAFNGNERVHGLYDLLLNHRSLLPMVSNVDVPILCAPIPFLNGALSFPEVNCKEIKRANPLQSKESAEKDLSIDDSKDGVRYSVEFKGPYLPPWIVSSVCSAMCSEGMDFEASFTTEPKSMGLNTLLQAVGQKSENDESRESSHEADYTFGISNVIVTSLLQTAFMKGLKHANGSLVASLSPL